MRYPAARSFTNGAIPAVEAWARCAVPNASITHTSAFSASSRAKAGSFASSSLWKRRFSSSTTWVGVWSFTIFRTPSPTQSSASSTSYGFPSSSERTRAAGSSESLGSTPFGRPRCDATMSFPPICSTRRSVGRASRIRVSSVTFCRSSSGTLKSTRTKTRFPVSCRSSMERNISPPRAGLALGLDQPGEVDHPVGEAPLVVVPGHHLGEVAVDDEGVGPVDDGRVRVAVVVDRDRLGLAVLEHVLQRARGGLLEGGVDLLGRRLLSEHHRQVHQAHVGRGNANAHPVHLALQRGNHLADGLRSPGAGGNHRQRRRPCPAEVLVGQVKDALVVGVAVHGGQVPLLDPEGVEEDL